MIEMLLTIMALFMVYVLIPSNWLATLFGTKKWYGLTAETNTPCSKAKTYIPEDAILRRHFMSLQQMEIESDLFPRPTDSILQRHYDALVKAELENRLKNIGRLQAC